MIKIVSSKLEQGNNNSKEQKEVFKTYGQNAKTDEAQKKRSRNPHVAAADSKQSLYERLSQPKRQKNQLILSAQNTNSSREGTTNGSRENVRGATAGFGSQRSTAQKPRVVSRVAAGGDEKQRAVGAKAAVPTTLLKRQVNIKIVKQQSEKGQQQQQRGVRTQGSVEAISKQPYENCVSSPTKSRQLNTR